jgi:hypothetical protein
MKKSTSTTLKVINVVAFVVAVIWAIRQPDFEPILASLGLLATLVSLLVSEGRSKDSFLEISFRNGHPFEVTHPADTKSHAQRCFGIGITNNGSEHIDNCLVKLERIKAADGRDFNNVFVPVGLATQHQLLQQRKGGRFNLSPGETKYAWVACLDETKSDTEIALQYETDKYPNLIPRGSYLLTLRAYGDGNPAEIVLRLFVDDKGYLRLQRGSPRRAQ